MGISTTTGIVVSPITDLNNQGAGGAPSTDYLLLETGGTDYLLLESGTSDKIIIE